MGTLCLRPRKHHVSVRPVGVWSLPREEHGWLAHWSKEGEGHVEETWTQSEAKPSPAEPHQDPLTGMQPPDMLTQTLFLF